MSLINYLNEGKYGRAEDRMLINKYLMSLKQFEGKVTYYNEDLKETDNKDLIFEKDGIKIWVSSLTDKLIGYNFNKQ